MKPKWNQILFAILISSCAANRIETIRTPDQLSNIKSGHFKGSELACPSPKIQHTRQKDKDLHVGQNKSHRTSELAIRRSRNGKNNTFLFRTSKVPLENSLVHRDRKGEKPGLYLPVISVPIKPTNIAPSYSLISPEQKEDAISKKNPAKYRVLIFQPVNPGQPKSQPSHKKERLVYLTVLFAGLLSLMGIKITPDLSASISYWAALNPWKSRFIISIIQIMTGTAGLILGSKLAYMGTHFTDFSRTVVAAIFFTSVVLYPVRKSRIRLIKRTYFRQKTHDLVLFFSGFLFMIYAGNSYSKQINSLTNLAENRNYMDQQEYVQLEKGILHDPTVFLQNANLEQDKPAKTSKYGWEVGLKVFFTILASVLLGFGVAALSCELSCSGLNGLAVIVAILGAGLIALLLYFSMKAIFNPKHRQSKSLSPA